MNNLKQIILTNEDWITERVMEYSRIHGYGKYTSTLKGAWRLAVSGLSNAILACLENSDQVPELNPDEDYRNDPLTKFGIVESQRHRRRGVTLGMFLGLTKYYRQSFIDLIQETPVPLTDKEHSLLMINRVFDRIEIAFCVEWQKAGELESERIQELQETNRAITNEKNKYLTGFESFPLPVVLLNREYRIENLNLAASQKFLGTGIPGDQYYYTLRDRYLEELKYKNSGNVQIPYFKMEPLKKLFPWLSDDLDTFISNTELRHSFEKRVETQTGVQYFNVAFSKMLDISDKFTGTLIIIDDITHLKLLQNQLIRSERLAATGQLAASIAHEINSPLQAITLKLSSLKKKYIKDHKLSENLDLLIGAFGSIEHTVKNLLDMNRPGTEFKQPVNINEIIENTVDLVQSYIKKNNIRVNLLLSPAIPTFTAFPQQLNQVLMNLINNSIEALSGISKDLTEKTQKWTGNETLNIRTTFSENCIFIDISDNGPGIPEADIEHIFDPFYTNKKTMGMGVGLSISHGIVQEHGGTIRAKNLPNGGTMFNISFPVD